MTEMPLSGHSHWEAAQVANRREVKFPAYGYLAGFEVRFTKPLPNMDASRPNRAFIEIVGESVEFEVIAHCLSVGA